MKYRKIKKGKFIERPNRFIALVLFLLIISVFLRFYTAAVKSLSLGLYSPAF